MSLGVGDKAPVRAGEPKGFPMKSILIAGGLAVAAIAAIVLLK